MLYLRVFIFNNYRIYYSGQLLKLHAYICFLLNYVDKNEFIFVQAYLYGKRTLNNPRIRNEENIWLFVSQMQTNRFEFFCKKSGVAANGLIFK